MLSCNAAQFHVRSSEARKISPSSYRSFGFAAPVVQNPCHPSPCGPNSQCREVNEQAVCSCIQGYIGSPPNCRPECTTNSECPPSQACLNQKCRDPCPGTCGVNARCTVVNHNPFCNCPDRHTGNPFIRCQPIGKANAEL